MHSSASSAGSRNEMHLADESVADLSTDEVAILFSFLSREDIMRARVCCTNWRDAAKKTLVPLTDFVVESVRKYNAIRVMSTALPNLQWISLCDLDSEHKYSDGEDPDEEEAARTANETVHDIDIISDFRKLLILEIYDAPLNGRYPALFNFPHLQKLTIWGSSYLKWDLEMLAGLPSLKKLHVGHNPDLSWNINSLRVLNHTLENVQITNCRNIRGNFMDLADFPRLKELDLRDTSVTGDIRDIRKLDFPAMESLFLPKSVRGGRCHEFQNVSDVPEFMHTIHLLLKRSPCLFGYEPFGDESDELWRAFGWRLSRDSLHWYDGEIGSPPPPFEMQFIQAGSRRGWSWCTWRTSYSLDSCEVNWLDPEPSSESSYEYYIDHLQECYQHAIDFYRGYLEPPTEEEYRRLCELLPR